MIRCWCCRGKEKSRSLGQRATENRNPAGRGGSVGTTVAKAGQLDLGVARNVIPSPCFNMPNTKHGKCPEPGARCLTVRKGEERFLRTEKEKKGPRTS